MARRSNDAAASARAGFTTAIAERAYFKAMDRGFAPGHELDDWLAAEQELAKLSTAPKRSPVRRKATTVKKAK